MLIALNFSVKVKKRIKDASNFARASLVAQTVKNPLSIVGDLSSIAGLGRPPGGGHGKPLQYSRLENPHGQRSLEGHSPWGHKRVRYN